MKTREQSIQKMFDSIAKHYDFTNSVLSMGRDKYWRRFTTQIVKNYNPRRVLDVCAGTGMLSLAIAREITDCQIIGIDFSKEMLSLGKKNLAKFPEGRAVTFQYGNARQLEFSDDSFDCATLAFSLRNIDNISEVLKEMKRVVRPGGGVISLELSKPENIFFQKIYYFYFYQLVPLFGRLISGNGNAYRYLPASLTNFPDRRNLENLFDEAGLINIRSFPLTGGIVAVHVGEKPLD